MTSYFVTVWDWEFVPVEDFVVSEAAGSCRRRGDLRVCLKRWDVKLRRQDDWKLWWFSSLVSPNILWRWAMEGRVALPCKILVQLFLNVWVFRGRHILRLKKKRSYLLVLVICIVWTSSGSAMNKLFWATLQRLVERGSSSSVKTYVQGPC